VTAVVTSTVPAEINPVRVTILNWHIRTKKAARSGPHLVDPLISYYLALAGGTMPFILRYSTI
jgi:hypothetical protein